MKLLIHQNPYPNYCPIHESNMIRNSQQNISLPSPDKGSWSDTTLMPCPSSPNLFGIMLPRDGKERIKVIWHLSDKTRSNQFNNKCGMPPLSIKELHVRQQ